MKNNLPFGSMESHLNYSISSAAVKLLTVAFLFIQLAFAPLANAQQLQLSDFVLYSGNGLGSGCTPAFSPGAGVLIGCNSTINGGSVGSLNLLQTTGAATISGNLNSKGTINLFANSIVTGKVTAANFYSSTGTILAASSGITIGGNIDVKGNIVVAGGSIYGKVTHPTGTTYTGPMPAGGNVTGTPTLPTFPALPAITTFPAIVPMPDIIATQSISPGIYDDIKLPGAKTLTFNGTGIYVFDKVLNAGDNFFVFDFKNNTTGVFKIYFHNDVDLNQIKVSMVNGGSASRIYTEVHGNGSSSSNGTYAFEIANCPAVIKSSWLGTVWAPYAAIKIGSLSGGTDITGALWSGSQVNVRCGVTVTAAPYQAPSTCTAPNVNAGLDKLLTCISPTQQLNGSSSTTGVSYNWVATNGGTIVSGATTATPTVNTIGTYTLTVTTSTGGCSASDVVVVTSLLIPPAVSAGADKQLTCNSSSVQLNGSSITAGVSYSWVASNGGNIVSGAATAHPTVNAAGTYSLTVLESIGGCTSTDIALVTSNITLPNANAGADKQITCTNTSIQLSGSSSSPGVSYNWNASNGGAIVSGSTTLTPTVNSAGTYTLTVTNSTTGCFKTDAAVVTSTGALTTANAGNDKQLTCAATTVQLNGSSTTNGAIYSWAASNGGTIVSGANTASPIVNAAGTYTLTVTAGANSCPSTDMVLVTSNTTLPNANAGSDKQLTCVINSVSLSGSSSTSGVSYSWIASNGGNIVSGANSATPTVNAVGTYTLKVTNTSTGCFQTDVALVSFSGTLPNANAGSDKQLTCIANSVQLSGSSSSTNVTYNWVSSNGGNIVSGANTATPTVNAAGTYSLTVTKTSSGCTNSDVALVTANTTPPNVNAGADLELTCTTPQVNLNGTSTTSNVQFNWAAGLNGNIISGANTNNPLVNGVGSYILTVTNLGNGCIATDAVNISNGCIFLYYPEDTVGKIDNVIGSELTSLYKNFNPIAADTTQNIFRIENGYVWIEVIARKNQRSNLATLLFTAFYGMTDTIDNGNSLIITGKFPIANLGKLDSLPSALIKYARPLYTPIRLTSGRTGVALTQGDAAMRANIARSGFNLTGEGIKVGLISDSYNKLNLAQQDVNNGDLPGADNNLDTLSVKVLEECSFPCIDEGRAMAQIVHDVAPGAELFFRTGFNDATDFAHGIVELQQAGCSVIVDDVTYITEPFFKDGVVAKAVEYVAAQGVSYFSAAGNFGNKSYQSTFAGTAPPAGITGKAHNFGSGDIYQKVSFSKGDYIIVLQWEDSIYSDGGAGNVGAVNDLDIYLTNDTGKILVGYNINNQYGDPVEVLPISVKTASAVANFMIVRAAGAGPVKFKYVIFKGDAVIEEFATNSPTIVGQSNANGAITVAAMAYNSTIIQDYSSLGGNSINNIVRNKPDITAPDGVSTTVDFGGSSLFFGTSAAAPHAAGVAALISEGKSKYYNQSINGAAMKSLLQVSAKDVGAAGFDFLSGSGLIQADAAIKTFAVPKPTIDTLLIPNGIVPGTQSFTVAINGENLNAQSKVFFKGALLPTVLVNSTQVSATIPVFNGNPAVQVYNEPTVPSPIYKDGGYSNKLFFTPKKKVVIVPDDKTKKYGEKLPEFTASITVDGETLAASGLTVADLKLTNLVFDGSSASSKSPALKTPYKISVSNASPLNLAIAADSILNDSYTFDFDNIGNLYISRLPLTIVSRDTTLSYGEKIDGKGLEYNYIYDNSNIDIADRVGFLDSLEEEHGLGITNAIALANGSIGRVVTNADLANLSLASSDRAIANGRVIVNSPTESTIFVDISTKSIFDFQANPDSVSLISGYPGENSRTLMNGGVITNGSIGRVVTNGSIGRVVTNGSIGRVVTNGTSGENSNKKLAFLIDSTDIDTITTQINGIKSINLITGNTVGVWKMVPGAFLSSNFDISYGIGTLTITKATLTVKADNKSRFYGSANPPLTVTYSGFAYGEGIANITPPVVSTDATVASPAGPYDIKVNGGSGGSNYTLDKVYGTLTVKKAILTATADNKSKIYGSANPSFTITYTGFVNGENVTSLLTQPVASTLATVLSNVGTYDIKLTGGSGLNYTLSNVKGTLTINKANLSVTADNKSKTYGSANPAFTFTYSGLLNGDGASSVTAPTATTTASTLSAVGNYPITVSGGSAANYAFIGYTNGTLSITKAALSIKANNKSIGSGAVLPSFNYTATGFISGGTNSVASGPVYAVSPVYAGAPGSYTITPSGLILNNTTNYAITYVVGTLTVSSACENIIAEFECVDTLINDPSGFHYIADLEYENDNNYTITIPIGSDNSLTGTYSGVQPTVFLPGHNHFFIPFNGSTLTYTIKSYEGTTKKTSTDSGNKNSDNCNNACRTTVTLPSITEQGVTYRTFSIYPNPALNSLYVSSDIDFTSATVVTIYDVLGKEQMLSSTLNLIENKFELDVSNLLKGVYFVKINSSENQPMLRFIKE